jgi:hypothetical protein
MLRRIGLGISYFVAIVYFLSILLPGLYCLRYGCRGPGELDAFMPAFALTPIGLIATGFSLYNAVQQIRRGKPSAWVFWPLATIFAVVLVVVIGLIVIMGYITAVHRRGG